MTQCSQLSALDLDELKGKRIWKMLLFLVEGPAAPTIQTASALMENPLVPTIRTKSFSVIHNE